MEYSEAIDAFEHAIKLNPKHADAYYNLGHAYFKLHRYEEALQSYKKAVELNSNNSAVYKNLGHLYRQLGRFNDACVNLKKSLALDADDRQTLCYLGDIYLILRRYQDAKAIYDALASTDKHLEMIPGDHYLEAPGNARDNVADMIADWLKTKGA